MTPKTLPAKKTAFVISPIGAAGTEVHRKAGLALKFIFKKAFDEQEWNVHRADEGDLPDSINQHVIKCLVEADLVIADLTGHNPNVFYELAVAHGLKKPVVHLIAEGEALPFDVIDQRTISYDITDLESVEAAVVKLAQYAASAINSASDLVTPLSSYATFASIRSAVEVEGNDSSGLAHVLQQVLSRLTSLEARIGDVQSLERERARESVRKSVASKGEGEWSMESELSEINRRQSVSRARSETMAGDLLNAKGTLKLSELDREEKRRRIMNELRGAK